MVSQKGKTILKSVIILLVLFTIVFAFRAHAADLAMFPDDAKAEYVDANGLPYFSEMDSYFNLRMTENYMDHGYFGDKLVNGSGWDMHSYYPSGREVGNYQPMIAYVTVALYNLFNLFTSMSITEVAFWTGAIIASFAVIPTYIFVRRLTNDYGAIVASLLVGLGPNYFAHTFAGFFDTDMFNVTLPLFFILFFIECVRSKNLYHKIIFGLLSIASIGVYGLSWTGFMFYPAVLVLVMIVFYLLAYIFKVKVIESPKSYSNKLDWLINQKELFSIVFIVVVGIIGMLLIMGPDRFFGGITSLMGTVSLQAAAASVWPNVLVSVAEMQIPNVLAGGLAGAFLANSGGVVNGIGGIVVLFGAIFVLYVFAQKVWNLRKAPTTQNKKPHKSQRKAAARRKEENMYRVSLKNIGSFGSNNEIYSDRRTLLLYFSLFFVWVIACLIAVSQGTRFIQALVIPLGLLGGIFVGFVVDYVKSNVKDTKVLLGIAIICSALIAFPITQLYDFIAPNAIIIGLALFIILAVVSVIVIYGFKSLKDADISVKKLLVVILITIALISPTVCGAYQTSETVVPSTSDPMYNSMQFIKAHTSEDTVIVSWWDFGYLFEIAADRPTSFDGGSQSGDRAFWVGRSLTTSDFALSKGILQMLATTGSNASDRLAEYTGSNATAVEALLKVLPMDAANAKSTLMKDYKLSEAQANSVVSQSHPANPNKVEFILSSDMIQKAGWWSYFGSWDFDNLESTNYQYYVSTEAVNVPAHSKGVTNLLSENGIDFNVVIDRSTNQTTGQTQAVFTNNGSEIDLNGTKYNPLEAKSVLVIEDGYLVNNQTLNKDGNYTLYLMGYGGSYTAILMDNVLENSVFTKLYLLGGAGQDTFKLDHMDNGVAVWTIA